MSGRFDEVDFGRIEPIRLNPSIALDVARSSADPLELRVAGTGLYVTDDSDGKVYVRFNDKDAARIPVQAGFSISDSLFKTIYLDWTAQPGKAFEFVYGTSLNVAPSNDVANLGGITSPVQVHAGALASHIYAAIGSTALQTLITPAANLNGIRVLAVFVLPGNNSSGRMMWKVTAPTSIDDAAAGTLLHVITWSSLTSLVAGLIALPITVPAGNGVYCQFDTVAGSRYGLEYIAL